jgi:hypothetical protein
MYCANFTRIDIAYATSFLSRYLAAPTLQHLNAANRILRYLNTTTHYALVFGRNASTQVDESPNDMPVNLSDGAIHVYSDASYGNDLINRKSTTGGIIRIDGDVTYWLSRKQEGSATSTTESEYYAISAMIKEALWTKTWYQQVFGLHKAIVLHCDNQAALKVCEQSTDQKRTKHIDMHYHFFRSHIANKIVWATWTPTTKMVADILTKAYAQSTVFTDTVKSLLSTEHSHHK